MYSYVIRTHMYTMQYYSVVILCRYDHKKRISSKDALMHPYFRPLRQSGSATSTATKVITTTVPNGQNAGLQAQSQLQNLKPQPPPVSASGKVVPSRTEIGSGLRRSANKDLRGNKLP